MMDIFVQRNARNVFCFWVICTNSGDIGSGDTVNNLAADAVCLIGLAECTII